MPSRSLARATASVATRALSLHHDIEDLGLVFAEGLSVSQTVLREAFLVLMDLGIEPLAGDTDRTPLLGARVHLLDPIAIQYSKIAD